MIRHKGEHISKIKRNYEYQSTLNYHELPAVCRVGSLSYIHGQLFSQRRFSRKYRIVLCNSRFCQHVHAGSYRHRGRPLDSGTTDVEPLSLSIWYIYHGNRILWHDFRRVYSILYFIYALRIGCSFLYAYIGPFQFCSL